MEINRLKSFLTILREGNLTRAAERLHLSQSALSSQLRQLEEELGLSLFRRTARGMELNDEARELVPLAENVLDAADRLAQRARLLRQGSGETLSIGLNAAPAFLKAGAINRRIAVLHGDINVLFVSSQTVRASQLLRQRQIDLAFFYGEPIDPAIHRLRLCEVRFCVVIPTALARTAADLDWPDVAALPWVWVEEGSPPYEALRQQFEKRHLLPTQSVQAVDEYIVKELVTNGQGLALMREDEARTLQQAGTATLWDKGWLELPLYLGWLAQIEELRRIKVARTAIEHLWQQSAQTSEDPLAHFSY